MKVLQINQSDLIGSRFQNFGIRHLLAEAGIESRHLVWNPLSKDPAVGKIFDLRLLRTINRGIGALERALSIHSILQLQSFLLPLNSWFREADVVHYHIVHDGYFSILAMPLLSRLKPSVWTWHDPWIMTGHCIYPMRCQRWQMGCGSCPNLSLPFAMKTDRTRLAFRQKRWTVRNARLDVVLASQYMIDMARQSPIGREARLHHLPFGIDLERFRPADPGPARRRLGVLDGRVVIAVRAFESPFKGFEYFVEALRRLDTKVPLCIVTTQNKSGLNAFIGKHQIIELGWVNDEDVMLDTFQAADLLVMPSTAEAFGIMAVEAMACGKPVIVFDGTSLPEVTFAPQVGISVPYGDVTALALAMTRLVEDPIERERRGAAGRHIAEQHYDAKKFAGRLAELYRSAAAPVKGQPEIDKTS